MISSVKIIIRNFGGIFKHSNYTRLKPEGKQPFFVCVSDILSKRTR